MARCIDWRDGAVVLLDQTLLPGEHRWLRITTPDELVAAIGRLAVRGAPALGAAGALGVALAARNGGDVTGAVARLRAARPTAVNLARGVDRAARLLPDGPEAVLAEACRVLAEEAASCRAIGRHGADLLERVRGADRISVLTHCNTGWLACVEWGTALGVVRELHRRDRLATVYAGETRPLLQGARLTVYELVEMGVEHRLVVDAAGPTVIARGLVAAVVVGADRVSASGDVVNKIGTYPLALAAARAGVPFVVAAPESTIDHEVVNGADVAIEDRDGTEVTEIGGHHIAPAGTRGHNPAFDVTPYDLVTALVTENGVTHPNAEPTAGMLRP